MLSIRLTWLLLCLLWLLAEVKLAGSNHIGHDKLEVLEHRSQRILWLTLSASLLLALIFKTLALAPIAIAYLPRQLLALIIFSAGLALRYNAVKTLGRLFTTNVTIHVRHELMIIGPYRWVRHPAYTGLIIAIAGAGLAMGDTIALVLLTLLPLIAIIHRIGIEEDLLLGKFGSLYLDYSRRTKKLIPWLY